MPAVQWKTIFQPEFNPGGLRQVNENVSSRVFDIFDDFSSDVALQAIWTLAGAGGGDTVVRSSAANAITGQQSMQVALTGGPATLTRAINNNFFHYPAGRRIHYVAFKATVGTGTDTVVVRLGNTANTIYKEWTFTVGTDKLVERIIDLYSGTTGGYTNDEGFPGPSATLGTWDPGAINTFSFRSLTSGTTYRFDDIRFFYQYGLLDALGFGTEPATDDGADGSLQSKLRKISLQVSQLVGTTDQYSKSQPHVAYLDNSYIFGLELKGVAEQGISTTTEIVPGNYRIERVRNGTTTEIVASSAASESAGFIFATYTPLEDNWQPGDEIIVTFSGGSVYNDTDTSALLTANAALGQAVVTVTNAALFQVGQQVRIYDDTPDSEWLTVLSIDSPTQITFSSNLVANYTTALNAAIILAEQTILETARLIANVTFEPELSKDLLRWVLADYDDFDFADADGNTERWDVGYIANSDGSAAGTEGGSANINTTTAGQARVSVDPDATPTQAAYALKRDEPSYSRYFSAVVDADIALNASQVTATFAGLRVSSGDIDDPNNYVLIAREVSSAVNRVTARAEFAGVVQATVTVAITDNALAFKIERYGNVWNLFYSLTQFPNQQWVKVTQFEDANGDMTSKTSIYLYTESGGTVDAQTAVADFDNWRYFIGSGAIDQLLSTSILASGTFTTSSATVPADTGRTEGDNFWNDALLMPISGVAAFQPRLIADFANAGGIFTIPSSRPFTSAPAVGDEYVILSHQGDVAPAADTTTNQTTWDVLGNKSDAASVAAGNASIIARLRAIEAALSVNAAAGGEFELDGDPDLWDALVNNSSADASITTLTGNRDAAAIQRLAAIINAHGITDAGTVTGFEEDGTGGTLWESIVAVKGTFTTSSATVPADTGRLEANDYFNGDLIIPLTGAVLGQARVIADFANAGGVFTLDSELPFTAAPGLVTYIIIHYKYPLAPAVDSAANTTSAHVVGNKTDTIPAMNLAPDNDSIVRQLKAILERVGATPADPDDSVLTNIGQRDDTATADTLADVTTTSIQAKLRRLLLRFSADAFSSTVQGAARTDVENMIQGLANYLSAAGAAWSVTANPGGAAKDNLEQTLEDFADMLAGGTGIVTFPARAVAGDGVSIAEVLRHVMEAVGENSADNVFDSGTVIANADGSALERLEDVKLTLGRAEYQLADYDDFDVADADANTERWDVGYLNGAEGGSANINTTTAGQLRVSLDPDVTPTASGYGVWLTQPIANKYFVTLVDLDVSSFGTPNASWATLGMRVSPTTYDANNVVYAQRQASSGGVGNRIAVGAIFNSASQGEQYFTTSDTSVAFKIERLDNVWRCYYSLSQYPDFVWTLLAQYEDPSEFMDSQQSIYLDAYSPGTADAQTAIGDFDNFKLYESIKGLSQEIAGDYDSSAVAEDGDGSVLERLEEIRGKTDVTGSPFTLTAAMTTVEQTVVNYTPTKMGRIAALFDLQTLVNDAYVGTITVRLKYMVDGVTLRTTDRADYLVGTDDVMPTVSGFVTEGASFVRLTIQANVAVDDAPAKTIPFRIIESS